MLLFELLINFFKYKNIEDFKSIYQVRLVENAKLIAANIDGEEHKKAIMMANSYFKVFYPDTHHPQQAVNNFYSKIFFKLLR